MHIKEHLTRENLHMKGHMMFSDNSCDICEKGQNQLIMNF
jgi:hypothetical protein